MKSNPQSSSEFLVPTSEVERSNLEELNDSELDAIAGGIETIIVEGPAPKFRGPSLNLLQAIARNFSSF